MVKHSSGDVSSAIGPALAQGSRRMSLRRRVAWTICLLVIAVLLDSSFHTPTPRGRVDEAPTSIAASNAPHHSPTAPNTRTQTIARAQQQLNRLADSSELADLLDLGSESHALLRNEFDVQAIVWFLPNDHLAALHTPTDASSMLLWDAGNGLANRRFLGTSGLGLAGFAGGAAASGDGSAGGQQAAAQDALLAVQGPSPDSRVTSGAGGNATGGGGENAPHGPDIPGMPWRSDELGITQGTSQTELQQPNSPASSSNTIVPVSEPATLLLVGAGLCGLGFTQRRRR
jgi:PEP-CTERM motif-containing protein